MNKMIVDQINIFVNAVILAMFAGLLYDLLRVFRRIRTHSPFFLNIEDLLYFFLLGFYFFICVFKANQGELRGYILLGFLLGVTIYYGMISSHVIYYISLVVKIIIQPLLRLIKWLVMPIIKLVNFIGITIKKIKRHLQKIIKWIIIRIRSILKELCNIVKYN